MRSEGRRQPVVRQGSLRSTHHHSRTAPTADCSVHNEFWPSAHRPRCCCSPDDSYCRVVTPTHRTSPTLEVVDLRIVNRLEAGPTWTLTGVSFRVYPQEVVALTGPPNPGLSALLSCLAGIVEADGGTVRVGGEVLSRRSTVERSLIRTATIGTVGRIDELVDDLTVLQNAEQSQRIAGVADPVLVALLISELGLTECVDAVPDMLTRSETVRAAVLVALAKRPQLLLADDPTAEADTSTSMMIARLLRRTSSTGVAGVLVTRDPALLAIADREISVAVSRTGP